MGSIAGSVSGGCIEDDLIERVRTNALVRSKCRRLSACATASAADEALRKFGLPCGGTLELVLRAARGATSRVEAAARPPGRRPSVFGAELRHGQRRGDA